MRRCARTVSALAVIPTEVLTGRLPWGEGQPIAADRGDGGRPAWLPAKLSELCRPATFTEAR